MNFDFTAMENTREKKKQFSSKVVTTQHQSSQTVFAGIGFLKV
jgi:hypothetical protein